MSKPVLESVEPSGKRRGWTDAAVAKLAVAYNNGGLDVAYKACDEFAEAEVRAKLEALGMLKLTDAQTAALLDAVDAIRKHGDLGVRYALAELRKQ